MYCRHCNSQVIEGSKICFGCGIELTEDRLIDRPLTWKMNDRSLTYSFNPYSAQKEEKAEEEAPRISEFYGPTFGLIAQILLYICTNIITCGLVMPWAMCHLYKWILKRTVISGKKFYFFGYGADLFWLMLKWSLASLFTLGIYGLFIPKNLTAWFVDNTMIAPAGYSSSGW